MNKTMITLIAALCVGAAFAKPHVPSGMRHPAPVRPAHVPTGMRPGHQVPTAFRPGHVAGPRPVVHPGPVHHHHAPRPAYYGPGFHHGPPPPVLVSHVEEVPVERLRLVRYFRNLAIFLRAAAQPPAAAPDPATAP